MEGFIVAFHHGAHIFRSACPALNLKHAHAGVNHFVEEVDGFQVFRTHDILVLDGEFVAGVAVGHHVGATANLSACAAIGAGAGFVQTHVAFAAHRHTQGAVAKHFDAHLLSVRSAHIIFHNGLMHSLHLVHIQFARQHLHIRPLRIVAHGFAIAHIHLCGNVHFHIYGACIENGGYVAGYDSAHPSLFGGIHYAVHIFNVFLIDDGVHSEVTLDMVLVAPCGYGVKVADGEIHARTAPHVQSLNPKIYSIGATLPGCGERIPRTHGRHNFKIASLHGCQSKIDVGYTLAQNYEFFAVSPQKPFLFGSRALLLSKKLLYFRKKW